MTGQKDVAHTLYRFFDATGALLYVGRTVNARQRWRDHERTKAWFAQVSTVKREVYASAEEVDAAERHAIATESPIHNIALNPNAIRVVKPVPLNTAIAPREGSDLLAARQQVWGETLECTDSPGIESYCECTLCHDVRMLELERIEGNYSQDERVLERLDVLRLAYADGYDLASWVCDLLDIELFRPMELSALSRISPAPAFCTSTDAGIQVGCPFCNGVHDHYLQHGQPIEGVLAAPCRAGLGGFYKPFTDYFSASDAYYVWLDSEAQAVA